MTKACIVVEQVTNTQRSAGITMKFDANNAVSGHFEATICHE